MRSFTRESSVPLVEAHGIIAKQMRACYAVGGLFGNGYQVHEQLDSAAGRALVEVYAVGAGKTSSGEETRFARLVQLEAIDGGTRITSSGTIPRYAYATHNAVGSWLDGNTRCNP